VAAKLSHAPSTVACVPDALLDDLDARQREAVTNPAAPLAIIAPAGSGKTRVLTRRIAYRVREGSADARHVLAVTFTRKAAGELAQRLRRLGVDATVTAGTFHALALAQLRGYATDRHRPPPNVLDRKTRVLAPLLGVSGPEAALAVADVSGEIEWAKARLIPPDRYVVAARAAGRRSARAPDAVADVYARYEHEKRRRHLVDFDDLLLLTADAIATDADFAASQRWRFRHVFVDEFQDATPLQFRLLRAWLGERTDLCAVGDPAQSIYGFAGADASPLAEFARAFPGGQTVTLVHNYRSSAPVVAVAEAALAAPARPSGEPPRAVRLGGDHPTITEYADDAAESAAVADACWRAFTAGVPWNGMAILFRTNAQASLFETACTRRGVPFRLRDGASFAARPAVRLLLRRLRECEREAPTRHFADHLAELAIDLETDESARSVPPDELAEHRDALLELAREYLAADGGRGSTAAFTAWLELATRGEQGGAPGVDLATFHRAKGLEWHTVFVCGLERGLVPISWASTADARAEERRLLHVALSRATDVLHVSWARVRTVGARRADRDPSSLLAELQCCLDGLECVRVEPAAQLAGVKATLAAVSPPPPTRRRTRR
jgi:DNA helicase-2/ATP-dependent DNA helicase PcrA